MACASQKKPVAIKNAPKPIWVLDAAQFEPVPSNKPSPAYEAYGQLFDPDTTTVADKGEPVIGEEVENTIAPTKLSEVPLPDVPLVLNQQVEKWMKYFQGRGRKYFVLWLGRSGRYVPMMKQILRDNGLPEGLIYLSMIESGFKPYAYSHAKAVGPWQFMKFTGAQYGLRANYWIDERIDPEKSTIAAAQHLKDLYDEFDHWYLAAAGYNAGAGKISKAIKRYDTEDYWEMSKFKYLKAETKNYVPKMLAASIMASDPVKYGFVDIQYENPVPYEKVLAPEPVTLEAIASSMEIGVDVLTDLNPEIRRGVTPPDYPNYELKIPVGFTSKFQQAYPNLPRYKVEQVAVYRTRSGDTLSKIAHRYGVSINMLAEVNHLPLGRRLKRNQEVMVPLGDRSYPKMDKPSTKTYELAKAPAEGDEYVVQNGDTLWKISRSFNVTVSQLRKWNGLRRSSIHPGEKLIVSAEKKSNKSRKT